MKLFTAISVMAVLLAIGPHAQTLTPTQVSTSVPNSSTGALRVAATTINKGPPILACARSRRHGQVTSSHARHGRASSGGHRHIGTPSHGRSRRHERFPMPGHHDAPMPELPPDEEPLAPVTAPDPNHRPTAPPTDETELSPAQRAHMQWAYTFMQSLHFQKGEINVASNTATLHLGEDFEYLKAEDAQRVLVQVWSNAPDPTVLGLIVPANTTPFAPTSWGVAVRYFNIGHVATVSGAGSGGENSLASGANAAVVTSVTTDSTTIPFASLLPQLQASTRRQNPQRIARGGKSVELLRWISAPVYLPALQAIHWGKELRFGQEFTAQPVTTLNYQIRLLGRRGVLELNFVGTREQFADLNAHLPQLLSLAQFTPPNRYSDFNGKTDPEVPGGLVSLITGEPPPPQVSLLETRVFGRPWWLLVPAPLALIAGAAVLWRRGMWGKGWWRKSRWQKRPRAAPDSPIEVAGAQTASAPGARAESADINTST